MTSLALLLALSAPAADPAKPVPAKVTITAEVVCGHCAFGIESEGGCFAALKLDDKTPVLLKGKAAESLKEARFDKKVYVTEGTLTLNKDKQMVLTLTSARERTDADKGKVPEPGQAAVTGTLEAKDGKLTIQNGEVPVAVETKATPPKDDSKPVSAVGKVINKDGKVTIQATELK